MIEVKGKALLQCGFCGHKAVGTEELVAHVDLYHANYFDTADGARGIVEGWYPDDVE